jgi:hypothetical protein
VVNFADMLRRMGKLERDVLQCPASRKGAGFDRRHLVRYVGVARDGRCINASCSTISPSLYSFAMVLLRIKPIDGL